MIIIDMIIFYSAFPLTLVQLFQNCQQNSFLQSSQPSFSGNYQASQQSDLRIYKNEYEQCLVNELKIHKQRKLKKIWSQKEDLFLENAQEQGQNWNKISSIIGVPALLCKKRFRLIRKQRKRWPKQIDSQIISQYEEMGPNWVNIAYRINKMYRHIIKYNSKQIKERYLFHLKPGISKEQWTEAQDLLLLQQIHKKGRVWKSIAQFFHNRTELQLKNRFYGTLKHVQAKAIQKLQQVTPSFDPNL